MRINETKAKLQAGEPVLGIFVGFASPTVVELCGIAGFDFVVIDSEHGPMNPQSCEEMVRAADVTGITPIIRVAQNVSQVILRYLDIGALGIQMPIVNTRADAERLVQAVKYPPEGRRGLASVRAASYGLGEPLADYVVEANKQTMVISHVENVEAVNNLDELTQVPGIDVFFIGPTDLSQSLGYPGKTQDPAVREVIAQARQRIQAAGRVAGFMTTDAAAARRALAEGFRYVTVNTTGLLGRAARSFLAEARG
ncbi:MAG: 4-hydroxy-2-oxovalerate aldolase [Chloroflexi bacterium]|nr:4-hydroxy-2-oxovalerate aldolase [Chloroflexota bacterium]